MHSSAIMLLGGGLMSLGVALLAFSGYVRSSQPNPRMLAVGLKGPSLDPSGVQVELMHVAVPEPKRHEVLIQVHASSVNHLDLLWKVMNPSSAWYAFNAAWSAQGDFPKVLGLDVAGTVVSVGSGTSRLQPGDEVWGFNAAGCVYDGHTLGGIAGHTWAERVVVAEDAVGLKPSSMSFAEAAAMPLVAQTSLQSLKLAGAPWHEGGTVLVLGATSGTGHLAVQLAKILGATRVIATASSASRELVNSLGSVDQFIDYHTENWWNASVIADGSLTAVFDTVLQSGTGDRAFQKLKQDGKFVSMCGGIPECGAPMASSSSQKRYPTISQHAVRCTAGACAGVEQLDELRSYVEAGKLKVHVERVLPLEDIKEGIALLNAGHVKGKVVLSVGDGSKAYV